MEKKLEVDEILKLGAEKWSGKVYELTIGATSEEGGSRDRRIKLGGENCLPFLHFEGEMPNAPKLAMEIWDMEPVDWPASLKKPFGDTLKDPLSWAQKCVEDYGVDLLCLRLVGAHPDNLNRTPDEIAPILEKILQAVKVPLIIVGSGDAEKDQDLIFKVCEVTRGENCLIGLAVEANYKSLVASCMSGGHSLIAETPIDINLCKQLNILISDMDFPLDRIVIHHATGALGYGLEYTYSIIERTRLAALQGDKMLSQPMISFIGREVWKTKEAKSEADSELNQKGIFWEVVTGIAYLQAGADLLVVHHPTSFLRLNDIIEDLMSKEVSL